MKKTLCILGIAILLFLLLLPPVLRLALPDLEEKEEKPSMSLKYLTCTGVDYVTRTNYENDKPTLIVIRKNKKVTSDENEVSRETTSENSEKETLTEKESSSNETLENNQVTTTNNLDQLFQTLKKKVLKLEKNYIDTFWFKFEHRNDLIH